MRFFTIILTISSLLGGASLSPADTNKREVPILIKELKSRDAKVRISAAEELGHIGAVRASDAREAVPVLLGILKKDKEASVRKAAVTALGKMDPDRETAVPAFMEALKDKSPAVRIAAAEALAMLGEDAKDAIPALREAQKDKDRGVSRAASMALRAIVRRK